MCSFFLILQPYASPPEVITLMPRWGDLPSTRSKERTFYGQVAVKVGTHSRDVPSLLCFK